jgi:hypothetical protein
LDDEVAGSASIFAHKKADSNKRRLISVKMIDELADKRRINEFPIGGAAILSQKLSSKNPAI